MSYTIDIYRDKISPLRSIVDFGFYVSFFPQLVAGPIVRAEGFVPQINTPTTLTKEDFDRGTYLILKGLVKKVIFADYIAIHFLDKVFDNPHMFSGFSNVMAMIGYSLQIYGDFSGYTDIAIGLAMLLGFKLPKNFNSPYKAIHCGDFWKRWHMSLSSWLKDYLYIPLGGNRTTSWGTIIVSLLFIVGTAMAINNKYIYLLFGICLLTILFLLIFNVRFRNYLSTNINIMLTMLLGGLWHGASWKFVIWGGLNGLGIVWYKIWRKFSPYENSNHWAVRIWRIGTTFIFITFTRVFFRLDDMAHVKNWFNQVKNNMQLGGASEIILTYRMVFLVMMLGYITHWLPESFKNSVEKRYSDSHMLVKIGIVLIVTIVCYQAFSADFQPFIYFQF